MSATFLLILGALFVWLAATGRWKAILGTLQSPNP